MEPRALVMEPGYCPPGILCPHSWGPCLPQCHPPSLLIPVFQFLQETPQDANRAVGRTKGIVMGEDRIFSSTRGVSTPYRQEGHFLGKSCYHEHTGRS